MGISFCVQGENALDPLDRQRIKTAENGACSLEHPVNSFVVHLIFLLYYFAKEHRLGSQLSGTTLQPVHSLVSHLVHDHTSNQSNIAHPYCPGLPPANTSEMLLAHLSLHQCLGNSNSLKRVVLSVILFLPLSYSYEYYSDSVRYKIRRVPYPTK